MMNSRDNTTVDDCRMIALPSHVHEMGSLTVAENSDVLPFAIKRLFYIYDIPADSVRGGHAHHKMNEIVVAVSGCLDVELFDGSTSRTITLRHPGMALFIPAGIWRSLCRFSSGCVVLSLCDTGFDEMDYIRRLDDYMKLKHT